MKRPFLAFVFAAFTLSCSSTQEELERVAKDWCMTIRASQVIPVYPLTEDLQPGDVFLVELPQNEQHRLYEEKGFLPLDHMLTRLSDIDYAGMYGDAYWKGTYGENVPNQRPLWQLGEDLDEDGVPDPKPREAVMAPRAAFPSYHFKLRKGTSFGAALPIQGVPVAMSFMRATDASGTATISDAFTYAVQPGELTAALTAWAAEPEQRDFLRRIGKAAARRSGKEGGADAEPEKSAYVRVVQRVYLTGGVVVSVTNTSTSAGGLSAGASAGSSEERAVSILDAEGAEAGSYELASGALSNALQAGESPGGSIQLVEASERSVSLKENFDRPLVIGYVGLDFRITPDGDLEGPISTLNLLEGREDLAVALMSVYREPAEAKKLRNAIGDWAAESPANEEALGRALEENGVHVGARTPTLVLEGVADPGVIRRIAEQLGIDPEGE